MLERREASRRRQDKMCRFRFLFFLLRAYWSSETSEKENLIEISLNVGRFDLQLQEVLAVPPKTFAMVSTLFGFVAEKKPSQTNLSDGRSLDSDSTIL